MAEFTEEDVAAIVNAVEAEVARQLQPVVDALGLAFQDAETRLATQLDSAVQGLQEWFAGQTTGGAEFLDAVVRAAVEDVRRPKKKVVDDEQAT